jgi:hypothetical protein
MATRILGRKADRMGEHSARPDRPTPGSPGANDTTWVFSDPEPADPEPVTSEPVTPESATPPWGTPASVTQFPMTGPPVPPPPPPPETHPQTQAAFAPQTEAAFHPQTQASFHPQTQASFDPQAQAAFHPQTEASLQPQAGVVPRPRDGAAPPAPPTDFVRYGPGVPMTPEPRAGLTAEDIWRTGLVAGAAPRRKPPWRRALGPAVTVVLLAVAAVILFLRFHHAPFAVTSAAITQQTRNGCSVDVTGKIVTSGGAGTVSYQWVFRPDSRPPQPLTQSVIAGQKAVFVTVAVEGSGQGSAAQSVTLQVLGPDKKSAATSVVVKC